MDCGGEAGVDFGRVRLWIWDNKRLADRGLWRRLRESGLKRDAAVRRENGGTDRLAGLVTAWRQCHMQHAACTHARSGHVLCTEQQSMESVKRRLARSMYCTCCTC